MFFLEAPPQPVVQNQLRDWIVRYRLYFFLGIALVLLLSFNGRWRVGLDSAVYRGMAANIAAGKGFVFGEFGTQQVYPGLPLVLAAFDRLTGTTPPHWPILPLLFMYACTVLSLVVIYHLILLHYPRWVATVVTVLMGFSHVVIKFSNEVLTDIPFLLGLMTAIYGWERLRLSETARSRVVCGGLLVVGMIFAASMRPTFLIAAAGWALVCVWGLITARGQRWFYGMTLAVLVLVSAGFTLLDPRTESATLFGGGYEREAIDILRDVRALPARVLTEGYLLLEEHLPEAFFGQRMPRYTGIFWGLLLVWASLLVMRRQPLWGLLPILMIIATAVLSSQPRYYIMVLPFLLLGWLLMLSRLATRLRADHAQILMIAGLVLVLGMNLSKVIPLIIEQRSTPFVENYRNGRYVDVLAMADLVREHVEPGKKVLAPYGSILRYLSGREVLSEREALPLRKSPVHWPSHLRTLELDYAFFPRRVYEREPDLERVMANGVLVAGPAIATMKHRRGEIYLAPAVVSDRQGDWREWDSSRKRAKAKKPPLTPRQQRLRERREMAATRPWLAETAVDPKPPQPLSPRQQRLKERREMATTRPWLAEYPIESPGKWQAVADHWLDPNDPPPSPAEVPTE